MLIRVNQKIFKGKGIFFLSFFLLSFILFLGRGAIAEYAWNYCNWGMPALIFSEDAPLLESIGSHYFTSEQYDINAAQAYFEKALEVDPYVPVARYQLARIHFVKGDLPQAIHYINTEIALFPENGRSYYIRGLIHGFDAEYDKAVSDFKRFLEWMPNSWAGHNDIVWVFFIKGDLENAETYARKGLDLFPRNPWLSNALGVILLNKGEYVESEKYLLVAQEGFAQMTPEEWGRAYPGNDPRIYSTGYEASQRSIEENLVLLKSKKEGV